MIRLADLSDCALAERRATERRAHAEARDQASDPELSQAARARGRKHQRAAARRLEAIRKEQQRRRQHHRKPQP